MSEYTERLVASARRAGKSNLAREYFRRYVNGGRFGRLRRMLSAAAEVRRWAN